MRKMRWRRGLCLAAWLGLLGSAASRAEQFWIAYEGDDYPENQGWKRVYGNENGPYAGGANRSLADGILTIDSLSNIYVCDFYEIHRHINPGPGEVFMAEWRVLVDPRSDASDVGVVIARDEPAGDVFLELGPAGVIVEPGHVSISLPPDVFHSFFFRSDDMETYDLFIDGVSRHSGRFDPVTNLESFVNFGDGVQGQRSLSQWDYFRFGVVPEPASAAALLLGALLGVRRTGGLCYCPKSVKGALP